MGGELIGEIISAAEWTRNDKFRLILQPMTAADELRKYLAHSGYEISHEALAKEDKIYQIICAEFTGQISEPSPVELYFGRQNLEKKEPLFVEFAARQREIFIQRREGRRRAGLSTAEEDYFLAEIEKILGEII